MSREADIARAQPVTVQEAEEACERLEGEIERAKKLLREYRTALSDALSDNDNR